MNNPQIISAHLQSKVLLISATLDGKNIAYSSETEFRIQTASPKGSWTTRYTIRGKLGQAVLYFNAINLGFGWRKRLYAPGLDKPVLAKAIG